jgi:hypothetical protein
MGIYSLLITYYSLLQNHRAYPSPDGDAARTGTPRANTAVRMSIVKNKQFILLNIVGFIYTHLILIHEMKLCKLKLHRHFP